MTNFDLRKSINWGLIAGLSAIFTAAVGIVETFDKSRMVVSPLVSLGFLALLWLVPVLAYRTSLVEELEGVERPEPSIGNAWSGAVVGATAGIAIVAFTFVLNTWDIREIFIKFSPALLDILTFNRSFALGALIMLVLATALGAIGGAMHLIGAETRRRTVTAVLWIIVIALFERFVSQILRQVQIDDLFDAVAGRSLVNIVYNDGGLTWGAAMIVAGIAWYLAGRPAIDIRQTKVAAGLRSSDRRERTRWSLIAAGIVAAVIIVAPMILGSLLSEILANVGLFLLMGLGLNIVVGLAGLLDLGYVAFFAVGAYSIGLLTSPQFNIQWSWWTALPVAIALSALMGLLVGTPVIRMRGDYLAIVTLGFGEIVRILFLSDFLKPLFGAAQGITRIPPINVGVTSVSGINPQGILYFAAAFVILASWISYAVQSSRVGRAWTALREDESVAQVMGIDTVKAKLSAFVVGAILAGFGGALFAAKVGSIFPTSFRLLVSIIILVIVIVGGMGSIRGVMLGSLVLIGVLGGPTQPGLLLEFADFKLLIVGVILVYMMLQRPEGLVPSVRRSRELHHEELSQDAWFDKSGEFTEDEAVAADSEDGS